MNKILKMDLVGFVFNSTNNLLNGYFRELHSLPELFWKEEKKLLKVLEVTIQSVLHAPW